MTLGNKRVATSHAAQWPIEAAEGPSHQTPTSASTIDDDLQFNESLNDLLWSSLEGNENQEFIPADKLDSLITDTRVYNDLQKRAHFENDTTEALESLTREICHTTSLDVDRPDDLTSRRKIYATLVLINRVETIRDFIQDGLYDCHLPFKTRRAASTRDGSVYRNSTPTGVGEPVPIAFFASWDTQSKNFFVDYQWKCLAPFLKMLSRKRTQPPMHYVFEDSRILPFMDDEEEEGEEEMEEEGDDEYEDEDDDDEQEEEEEEDEGQEHNKSGLFLGGFSYVWRVRIHPAHHDHLPVRGSPVSIVLLFQTLRRWLTMLFCRSSIHTSLLSAYMTAPATCLNGRSQPSSVSAANTIHIL